MPRINTQKAFATADRKQGNVIVGADFTMVIKGHELMTFNIKTNSLPMLKNGEKVEYTTTHGVKTHNDGYLQTLNDIPVTFMERDSLVVKNFIEKILLEDKNETLHIDFYVGRTVEKTRLWGTLKFASLIVEDSPEADSEATTTPVTISVTVSGHYEPPVSGELVGAIDQLLNLAK